MFHYRRSEGLNAYCAPSHKNNGTNKLQRSTQPTPAPAADHGGPLWSLTQLLLCHVFNILRGFLDIFCSARILRRMQAFSCRLSQTLQDIISPSISDEYHTQALLQLGETCLRNWSMQRFTEGDYYVDNVFSDPIKDCLDWKVIARRNWSKSSRIVLVTRWL